MVLNRDCMHVMSEYPDKHFDLAIVDPPYGLGGKLAHAGNGKNSQSKFKGTFDWDTVPDQAYFDELFRVSKNQIIWGGNYFRLPPSRGFICWDKMVYIPTMSQIEFAWTSFDRLPKLIKINNTDKNRIHINQKPISLYRWILLNYSTPEQKILDTHSGSGSLLIACDEIGNDIVACELDKNMCQLSINRFNNYKQQLKMF